MTLNRRIAGQIDRPADKRCYVRRLFAGIAARYDLTNDVMSLGLHRRWKRRLIELGELGPEHRVLDLAAGTGDLARGALGVGERGPQVFAADLTPEMMRAGRAKPGPALNGWVCADALRLPFPDRTFDRVLVGYGLRNFPDLEAGLAESFRCLRKGGRLISLDFGHPSSPVLRRAWFAHLNVSTRIVGWALHRDPESYVYIPESLRQFPDPRNLARKMESAGFERCGHENLMLGTMAINYGRRP